MTEHLPPGSVIGILGGGQLGRMLAIAAARLGFRCHIYCPDPDSPAFDLAAAHTVAGYDDMAAMTAFAGAVDVLTYEFENVPVDPLWALQHRTPVFPDPGALYMAQDRRNEKIFLSDLGIPAAPFKSVDSPEAIGPARDRIGGAGILKSRRFGYDGKGQARIDMGTDPYEAWREIGEARAILEAVIPFEREISVVAARDRNGAIRAYTPVENLHTHHILDVTTAPAPIAPELASQAGQIAATIVEKLGYVGVMGIEMFVVNGDSGPGLMVNEMAPRVHNSGHWTLDGAATDQFEQHIRAISGLPLGDPAMIVARAEMTNLIGAACSDLDDVYAETAARIHLYGKREARPGRKMGHITRLYSS